MVCLTCLSQSPLSDIFYVSNDSKVSVCVFLSLQCCQICCHDDNEAELLLCDCCDKGYHTYCFKVRPGVTCLVCHLQERLKGTCQFICPELLASVDICNWMLAV